jgi:hypothetical protein
LLALENQAASLGRNARAGARELRAVLNGPAVAACWAVKEQKRKWATGRKEKRSRQAGLRAKMYNDWFEVSFIISETYLMNLIHFFMQIFCAILSNDNFV